MEIIVGNGPRQASVYCASPPVVFGIRALSSDRDAMVVMLNRQAITMAKIKVTPIVPAPCPSETRQLVAMTSPTETEITLLSPNFFSSINRPPSPTTLFALITGADADDIIQFIDKDLSISDVTGIQLFLDDLYDGIHTLRFHNNIDLLFWKQFHLFKLIHFILSGSFSTPHPSTCITVIPRTPALLSAAFKLENFDMPVITSILDKLMVFPPWYNALYNSSSGIFVPVMSRS